MSEYAALVAIDWADPAKITVAGDGVILRWDGVQWIQIDFLSFKPVAIKR